MSLVSGMISKLRTLNIGYRMLVSAFFGALISLVCFSFYFVTLGRARGPNPDLYLQDINVLEMFIGIAATAFPVMLFVGGPLVTIALLVGFIFRKSIAKRPAIWCLAAPVAAWILVGGVFSLSGDFRFDYDTFFNRFSRKLLDDLAVWVLLGCIPPTAVFYWLTTSHPKP